jgi:hypothetical protein
MGNSKSSSCKPKPLDLLTREELGKIILTGRKFEITENDIELLKSYTIQCNNCNCVKKISNIKDWIWETPIDNRSDINYKALCSDCYTRHTKLSLEQTIHLIKTGNKFQMYPKKTQARLLIGSEITCCICEYVTQMSTPGEWVWQTKYNVPDDEYCAICSDCYNNFLPLAGWQYYFRCC